MTHSRPRLATNQASSNPTRRRPRRLGRLAICSLVALTGGCGLLHKAKPGKHDTKKSYHDTTGLQIEYPDAQRCAVTPPKLAADSATMPLTLEDPSTLPTFDMTLDEAIRMAVSESPVLRSIGGSVVLNPQGTSTVYNPALVAASPTQGTEAALAAFDAQYTQQLFWATVDQPNNIDAGGVTAVFTPTALEATNATFSNDLSKRTAQGASFALRHVVNYQRNNQPFRAFSSAFDGWIEAEWRQPLLRGAGTEYNRIAGPNAVNGQYNGVLIARVNEDVALADFEAAVIQLVADVEQAYWDLYTAYRVLDSTVKGREAAQQTYQFQRVRLEVGAGRSDEEAQAISQYYQFERSVQLALGGTGGLYQLEQRLRYLIGMTATDGRLIRPSTEPTDVKVVYDWQSALGQSLSRRVEVRRQLLAVKRRELEVRAARLNIRPQLDLLAQYRWRGLGNHLIGSSGGSPLNNLYGTITGGDYQEGQIGFEMNFPVGLRAASVALAHAKLNLRRERDVLAETELRISHDLSEAARQISVTHQLLETNYNRFVSDIRQVDVLRRRYEDGSDNINFLLQAQRQVVDSAIEFYRSLGEYNLAIRDFHQQKGSLLAYSQVQLAEGPWAAGAMRDAYETGRFLTPRRDPKKTFVPRPISTGYFDPSAIQDTSPRQSTEAEPTPASDEAGELPAPMMPVDPAPQDPVPQEAGEPVIAPPAADPDAITLGKHRAISSPVTVAPMHPALGSDDGLISFGPSWQK